MRTFFELLKKKRNGAISKRTYLKWNIKKEIFKVSNVGNVEKKIQDVV